VNERRALPFAGIAALDCDAQGAIRRIVRRLTAFRRGVSVLSRKASAVLSLATALIPLSLASQQLSLVESIDRHLVRQNPNELLITVEATPGCRIGSDMLTETVVDVLRRGGLTKSEPSRLQRGHFALRVAVDCSRRASFLVEVDFVDRLPATSPGGPPGPAIRYLPSYHTFGPSILRSERSLPRNGP
jgi:hypothetical protein